VKPVPDLLSEQAPIDREIVNELIAATPEWWDAATLEVTAASRSDEPTGLNYVIASPKGLTDSVEATKEIRAGVSRLARLHAKRGHPWKRVKYVVHRRPDSEDWDTEIEFEYWSQ
jgi:hypothetical protein